MKINNKYVLYNDYDTIEWAVNTRKDYQELEEEINRLVDFAAEIREHEPTWRREK